MMMDCGFWFPSWPLSPAGPVPALPNYLRLHYEPRYHLTPLLILPYQLTPHTLPVSHPQAAYQMCRILRDPTITNTLLFLTLPFTNLHYQQYIDSDQPH